MKTMMWSGLVAGVMLLGASAPVMAQEPSFVTVGAQVKDDLCAGTEKFAEGASDVTEVNLDPRMLGMLGKKTSNDLAGKMEFIVVHSYEYDKPGMYKMEDVMAYRKKLMDGSWNCFIHSRDKDGATDICSKSSDDGKTNELVIMTAEPKELSFVHIKGHMTLDDLRKAGGSFGAGAGSSSGSGSSSSK
jgi:hypothetical protein